MLLGLKYTWACVKISGRWGAAVFDWLRREALDFISDYVFRRGKPRRTAWNVLYTSIRCRKGEV